MFRNLFCHSDSGNSIDSIIVQVLVGAVVADHFEIAGRGQFVHVDQCNLCHWGEIQGDVEQRNRIDDGPHFPIPVLLREQYTIDGVVWILGGMQQHLHVGTRGHLKFCHSS